MTKRTMPDIAAIRRYIWRRCAADAKKQGKRPGDAFPGTIEEPMQPWYCLAWKGHCGDLARTVTSMMGGCGCTVEGRYFGPVAKDSFFDKNSKSEDHKRPSYFIHSWIEDRGFIIDPTRWVFEAVDPYVFIADRFSKIHEEYVRIEKGDSVKKKWPDAMTGLTDEYVLHTVSPKELQRAAVRCQKWRDANVRVNPM